MIELPNVDSKSNKQARKRKSAKSQLYADSLFSFTDKLKYLCEYIEKGFIPIRYCVEDISYLKLRGYKEVAMPMKCFCDIKLHSIKHHIDWYGYYGIAFSKEWGLKHKMQPVQYINRESFLREDYSKAFNEAMKKRNKDKDLFSNDYLLDHLLFMKPDEGMMKNRNTNKYKKKCFTDECEWRYITDVTRRGFQIFYNIKDCKEGFIDEVNKSLKNDKDSGIVFDYDDIKYLIVKNTNDCNRLINTIMEKISEEDVRNRLISKIIVWEDCKEDF